jgi:hypothetical protein
MLHLAIIGSRTFHNYTLFKESIDPIWWDNPHMTIVSGGAKGADSLAARYAKERNLNIIEYWPDYLMYPKKIAPLRRNVLIIEKADRVVAFWDGSSPGTAYSMQLARNSNKPLIIVRF